MEEHTESPTSGLKNLAGDVWQWSCMAAFEGAETMAGCRLGQAVLRHADRALWLLEKSAQWALPPPPIHKADKPENKKELTRPLPWVLFLPMLFFLRFMREVMSLGALAMGREPVRPFTIVKHIQNWRRSLRAIKYQGIKDMRARAGSGAAKEEGTRRGVMAWVHWVMDALRSLTCYHVVKYSSCQESNAIMRKNSGEEIVVSDKMEALKNRSLSPDNLEDSPSNDEDINILKELISKIQAESESEGDDSDFSLSKMTEPNEDTSETSSDEDIEENEDKEACEPEDEQGGPIPVSVDVHKVDDEPTKVETKKPIKAEAPKDEEIVQVSATSGEIKGTDDKAMKSPTPGTSKANGSPVNRIANEDKASVDAFLQFEKSSTESSASPRNNNSPRRTRNFSPKTPPSSGALDRPKTNNHHPPPRNNRSRANHLQMVKSKYRGSPVDSLPVVTLTPAEENSKPDEVIIHPSGSPEIK